TQELGSGGFVSTGTSEASTDGLRSWQIAYGRTNQTQTVYGGSGSRTLTATAPDGAQTVQTFQNGLLVSQVTSFGSTVLSSLSFGYDSHARQNSITDARNGTTTLVFNKGDQGVTNASPAPLPGQPPQTTVSYYDKMGRLQ